MRNESLSYMELAGRIIKHAGQGIALVSQEGTTAKPMIRVLCIPEDSSYFTHDLDFLRGLQDMEARLMAYEYSTKSNMSPREMEKRLAEADAWLDRTLTIQGFEETTACMGAAVIHDIIDEQVQVEADTPKGKRWLEANNNIKMKFLGSETGEEIEDKETSAELPE